MKPSSHTTPRTQYARWYQHPAVMFSGLITLFMLPMLLAWLLVSHRVYWGTVNHGRLFTPPLSLSAIPLYNQHHRQANLQGYWWLVVQPGTQTALSPTTLETLHTIKQIYIALPKYRAQIRRALLLHNTQQLTDTQHTQLAQQAAGTELLWVDAQGWQKQIQRQVPKKLAFQGGALYLIDPETRIILAYPMSVADNVGGKAVMQDLKRLLKVSQYAPKTTHTH